MLGGVGTVLYPYVVRSGADAKVGAVERTLGCWLSVISNSRKQAYALSFFFATSVKLQQSQILVYGPWWILTTNNTHTIWELNQPVADSDFLKLSPVYLATTDWSVSAGGSINRRRE